MSSRSPGRCNDHEQMVLGDQQAVMRPDGHVRLCVLRCLMCGHEYGTELESVDFRRCPLCQEGPPGIALDDVERG